MTWIFQYGAGQVTGVTLLASAVLGADPLSPQGVYRRMGAVLTGHPYAKAPIDVAAWARLPAP